MTREQLLEGLSITHLTEEQQFIVFMLMDCLSEMFVDHRDLTQKFLENYASASILEHVEYQMLEFNRSPYPGEPNVKTPHVH